MQSPYNIIIAGAFDVPLMIVVLGTAALAIAVNVGAVVGWLRRRR
jgi:hypothetical protein